MIFHRPSSGPDGGPGDRQDRGQALGLKGSADIGMGGEVKNDVGLRFFQSVKDRTEIHQVAFMHGDPGADVREIIAATGAVPAADAVDFHPGAKLMACSSRNQSAPSLLRTNQVIRLAQFSTSSTVMRIQ